LVYPNFSRDPEERGGYPAFFPKRENEFFAPANHSFENFSNLETPIDTPVTPIVFLFCAVSLLCYAPLSDPLLICLLKFEKFSNFLKIAITNF
jgi:hypothetical protein